MYCYEQKICILQCPKSKDIQYNLQECISFLPSAHSGCRVLSCPGFLWHFEILWIHWVNGAGVRPCYHSTDNIFNRLCSYLIKTLALDFAAWILFIIGFLSLFSRILWYFDILRTHWLTGVWDPPFLSLYSPQYVIDHIWNSHCP